MIFMQRNLLFTFPAVCWTCVKFRKIHAILSILDISDWTFAMVINEKFLVLQVSGRKHYLHQLFDGTWSFLLVLRSDLHADISIFMCIYNFYLFFLFFSRMVKFEHPHVDHIFPLSENDYIPSNNLCKGKSINYLQYVKCWKVKQLDYGRGS